MSHPFAASIKRRRSLSPDEPASQEFKHLRMQEDGGAANIDVYASKQSYRPANSFNMTTSDVVEDMEMSNTTPPKQSRQPTGQRTDDHATTATTNASYASVNSFLGDLHRQRRQPQKQPEAPLASLPPAATWPPPVAPAFVCVRTCEIVRGFHYISRVCSSQRVYFTAFYNIV